MIETLMHHPTHLLIGPPEHTKRTIIDSLHQLWCKQSLCSDCTTMQKIAKNQHSHLIWIQPEDTYTKDHLNQLFETLLFKQDPNDVLFFILEKADTLNTASANKLLKSLEEPPPGYHFILTTDRPELILPTIYSRCLVTSLVQQHTNQLHPLAQLIINAADPMNFMDALEKTHLTQTESFNIGHQVFEHFLHQAKSLTNSKTDINIAEIMHILDHPPMPGSGKYFLRSLYIMVVSKK